MTPRRPGRSTSALLACLLVVPAAAASAPADEPARKPPRWTSRSENGLFRVTLRPEPETVPIGTFHAWSARVVDGRGRPVDGARIEIGGGMDGHGHGLPTAPRVTEARGNGEYRIEGVKFTMAGEWTLVLAIRSAGREDVVRFRIDVDY